jgi:Rad3-related DNA helicase
MQTRDFPFQRYRSAQRSVARKVYRTLENGEHLLLEAPTGSGKSMATIYPALKFMQSEQQLFFLTNRTTGAEAALKSASLIADSSNCLSVVQITAKDKMCRDGSVPCEPQDCARCKNYFARAPYAVNHLLEMGVVDRSKLQQVADEFVVCPYELSLDLAHWADMIIGDYNYLFDPFVKLQRFADTGRSLLLVDEAHQLSGRVSQMLSTEIAIDNKAALLESPSDDFSHAANEVFSVIRGLAQSAGGDGTRVIEQPLQLEAAAQHLIAAVEVLQLFDDLDPQSLELYFACLRWVRSLEWFEEGRYQHLSIEHAQGYMIQRLCLDSSGYISDVVHGHAASIRFSGTVSPLALYQRLHGCAEDLDERAASPFSAAQSAVLVVHDIPTYFRRRSDSLPMLSELVNTLVEARPGRYLIAFSSYSYLDAFAQQHSALGHVFRSQSSTDSAVDIQVHKDFVLGATSVVFGVVMGGSFSESVEFGVGQLSGVIVVGIGLPPPSLQKDLVVKHFDVNAGPGWGQMVAYTQPALTKVIQMAGRLVRSEHDRGIICLVDERFLQSQVQGFLPAHWESKNVSLQQVKSVVSAFWRMT